MERSTLACPLDTGGDPAVAAGSDGRRAEAFTAAAAGTADPLRGTLRLDIIPIVAPYVLPVVLAGLAQRLPALTLRVIEYQTERLLTALCGGALDAALIALLAAAGGITEVPIYDEDFLLVVPPGHPMSGKRRVPESALADLPLLLDNGHCLRDQALEVCQKAGVRAEVGPGPARVGRQSPLYGAVRHSLMTLTTLDPPVGAVVSMWTQQCYGKQLTAALALLEAECDELAVYLVTESVPLAAPVIESGSRTNGLANIALLRRPPELDQATSRYLFKTAYPACGPHMTTLEDAVTLCAAESGMAVISTVRAGGTVQAPLGQRRPAATPGHRRAGARLHHLRQGQTRQLARPPATGDHVPQRLQWATVEGGAERGRSRWTRDPGFALTRTLTGCGCCVRFTAAGGTHDDWDEYDRVMALERRAVVLIAPT